VVSGFSDPARLSAKIK